MANEVLPEGRGYVYVEVEATYNTNPTPGEADVLYVEDFTKSYTRDNIERTGVSRGHPGGFLSVPGAAHQTWSLSAEMCPQDIETANDSDAPNIDPVLRGCGFVRTSDSDDATHTYTLDPSNHESFTLEAYEVDSANADVVKTVMTGCRGNATLSFNPGERIMCSASGSAVYGTAISSTGVGAATLTYPADRAMVASGTVKLINLDDNSLYGGGSVGSPGNAVLVRSLEIDCGMSVNEHMGLSATAGVGRVYLHGGEGPTANLVVEQVEIDDWDPWSLRDDQTAIECNFTFTQPGGSNTMQVVFYGQIVGDIDEAESDGLKTWGLTVKLRYPEDADGVPAVGYSPSQTIKAGTNQGIGLDPASALPATVLAIQFRTPS